MSKQTSIRVRDDLYQRALEWCKKNDRTFAKLVEYALISYLDSLKKAE